MIAKPGSTIGPILFLIALLYIRLMMYFPGFLGAGHRANKKMSNATRQEVERGDTGVDSIIPLHAQRCLPQIRCELPQCKHRHTAMQIFQSY